MAGRGVPTEVPEGGWGWVVCLASSWTTGVVFGVMNSFGVLTLEGADAFKTYFDGICKRSSSLIKKLLEVHVGWTSLTDLVKKRSRSDLIQSFLHVMAALVIVVAGIPVLVAGSISNERVTLQMGERAVIPFNLTCQPNAISYSEFYFMLHFESVPHPFCLNGKLDVEGFKHQSQFPRFSTSVEGLPTSPVVNLFIDNVDALDEDKYIITFTGHDFQDACEDSLKKDVLVHTPPGPAKCFITFSEDNSYQYEVHCQAATGSTETTITCFQDSQQISIMGEITDNGMVRAIFFLPHSGHFSCCSHDANSVVTAPTCNDFDWPPRRNITTQSPLPTYSTIDSTHISQLDSITTSRGCRGPTYRYSWWMTWLLVYLFIFVVL